MEHWPALTRLTLAPETVQTEAVFDAKLTVSPEDAVAVNDTGPADWAISGGCVNVIVCEPFRTAKVFVTGVAAANEPFPAWEALIEQVPTEMSVTLEPATVHLEVELLA